MNKLHAPDAPTQFVAAGGITFAYRRFGKKGGIPLVFNPHILGNLDSWDPAVTDGLAQSQEIILFDNAGIGKSSGDVSAYVRGYGRETPACLSMRSDSSRQTSSGFRSVP